MNGNTLWLQALLDPDSVPQAVPPMTDSMLDTRPFVQRLPKPQPESGANMLQFYWNTEDPNWRLPEMPTLIDREHLTPGKMNDIEREGKTLTDPQMARLLGVLQGLNPDFVPRRR